MHWGVVCGTVLLPSLDSETSALSSEQVLRSAGSCVGGEVYESVLPPGTAPAPAPAYIEEIYNATSDVCEFPFLTNL